MDGQRVLRIQRHRVAVVAEQKTLSRLREIDGSVGTKPPIDLSSYVSTGAKKRGRDSKLHSTP